MTMGGKRLFPHVVACVAAHGERPPGMDASHQCGPNGLCINPRHLAWETHGDNVRRSKLHGTAVSGERHGMAKLTAAQAAEIRQIEGMSQAAIGSRFGVSQSAVSLIRRGERWQ